MMRLSVQDAIKAELRHSPDGLTLDELTERTNYHGHEVRTALKSLLHDDSGVYVRGVEERERQYDIRDQ